MLQLCKKLDVKKSVGGDYRYLAAYFDMSTEDIDLISEKDDRTKEVLSYVGRNPTNTVSKLREIFVEMERDDCVAIIDSKYKQEVHYDMVNIFVMRVAGICGLSHFNNQWVTLVFGGRKYLM